MICANLIGFEQNQNLASPKTFRSLTASMSRILHFSKLLSFTMCHLREFSEKEGQDFF